jgi:hypothetical protein
MRPPKATGFRICLNPGPAAQQYSDHFDKFFAPLQGTLDLGPERIEPTQERAIAADPYPDDGVPGGDVTVRTEKSTSLVTMTAPAERA